MLLCIEIGNTNIVLGVFEDNKLTHSFRIASNILETVDEYGVKIIEILRVFNLDYKKIEGVVISSVVPGLDTTFEKMIFKYFNATPLFVSPGVKTSIKIKIDNPKQLGADILVGAVASYYKYGAPAIIIDMGTAITFAYVNENRELLGGIITPGIKVSFSSLVSKTSRLEEVKIGAPLKVMGKDTVSAIQSGMIYGTASMIDGMIRKIKKEMESKINPVVVLTGGESNIIKDYLDEKVIVDDNLLLEGLKIIYQKNHNIEWKYHPNHILKWVIFMLNDKGPLMFINTVNTQVNEVPHQKIYDSRYPKVKENPSLSGLSFLEERKLKNILEMYEKNRPVLCNIICEETELVGIPFKKDDVYLFVKTSEEKVERVMLNKITDIVIIKF